MRERRILAVGSEIVEMCSIADSLQRRQQRRRRVSAPQYRDSPGREVGARLANASNLLQRRFDLLQATATMHVGHREIGLADTVLHCATSEQHLLAGHDALVEM